MSNYSTRGKEVKENTTVTKWITPGSTQIAKIVSTEFVTAGTGTKGMKFTYMTNPVRDVVEHEFGTGQIAEDRLWLSEKAAPYSKDKVIMLADKLGVRNELDDALDAVSNDEGYVTAVGKVLRNVVGSFIFGGEEVAITDDETGKVNIWVKPTLYPFGAIGGEDDFGTLEERCCKLSNNDKLIKRLDVAPNSDIVSSNKSYQAESDEDDLF
jgi:hypothetical protein